MESRNRSNITGGVILILIGAVLLAYQAFPELRALVEPRQALPLLIIGIGATLFVIALLTGAPDLVVGACVVAGIGGILYWQNATGNFASWSYAWALIPGFAGVGVLLSQILRGDWQRGLARGGRMIVTSAVLFVIFASFFGGLNFLGAYWPMLLIALGVFLLAQSLWRTR